MRFDSESKRKPCSPPIATKLTPEQAKQFLTNDADCGDLEAMDFLESLRREQQQNAK